MTLKAEPHIIKETLENTGVTSSSDLIVALYQIFSKTNPEKMLLIDPIYRWEYTNYHDEWTYNIRHITKKLQGLDFSDYNEVEKSYMTVIDCLFEIPTLKNMYPLDENDFIGWNIFKELKMKLEEVRKHRAIIAYYGENREAN